MARKCAFCSEELGEKALFCGNCGAKAPQGAVCKKCGSPLGESAKFCKECGAAVIPVNQKKETVCAYCGERGNIGSQFCKNCGATMATADDAVISKPPEAVANSAEERPAPPTTCPGCGLQVREGAAFCKRCGASLTGKSDTKLHRTVTASVSSKHRSVQQGENSVKKAPTGSRRRIMLRLVAAVLVVAFVITGVRHYNFYWRWDESGSGNDGNNAYSDGDIINGDFILSEPFFAEYTEAEIASAPLVSAAVNPENHAAHSGEVTVDFGEINLPGSCTLSTQTLPMKTAGDGGTGQEFRFTLTDDSTGEYITEFALPVHITLPKGEGIPMIYYRNPKTGTDELVPSETDEAAGTITFATDHFSGFWKTNLKANGTLVESTQYLFYRSGFEPTSPVCFCDAGVDKLIWQLELDDIVKAVNTKGMTYEDGVTLFITSADTAMDADEARQFTSNLYGTAAQPALKSAATVFKLVGPALLAAKVSYQLYHGSDLTTVILDNGADIVENMLVLCGVVTGAPPLFAAATAVFAANAAYTAFAAEPEIPDDFMYMAYNNFNSNCVYYEVGADRFIASISDISGKDTIKLDFGGSETARALRRIYNRYKSEPEQLNRITSTFMERYIGFFFDESNQGVASVRKTVYEDTVYNDGKQSLLVPRSYKWYTPTEDDESKYVAKARESLTFSMKPIFDGLTELAFLEAKQALMNVLQNELLPYYNKTAVFELIDPSLKDGETFASSVYADRSKYSIDFATPELRFNNNYTHFYPELASDPYNFNVTPGSNEVFRCVNYLYWEMSCPTQLRIRKNGVDEMIINVPFEFNDDGVTTIVLPEPEPMPTSEPTTVPTQEPAKASNEDYLSGTYTIVNEDYLGSLSLHLTIKDDIMTANIEGIYTFNGSYSVDSHTGIGSCTEDGVTVHIDFTLHPNESPVTIDVWFVGYSDIRDRLSCSGYKSG